MGGSESLEPFPQLETTLKGHPTLELPMGTTEVFDMTAKMFNSSLYPILLLLLLHRYRSRPHPNKLPACKSPSLSLFPLHQPETPSPSWWGKTIHSQCHKEGTISTTLQGPMAKGHYHVFAVLLLSLRPTDESSVLLPTQLPGVSFGNILCTSFLCQHNMLMVRTYKLWLLILLLS